MRNRKRLPVAPDPLIDDVRAIRESIFREFGNDLDRLIEHLQGLERHLPGRVGEGRPTTPPTPRRKHQPG
jgi:hypothetical protein